MMRNFALRVLRQPRRLLRLIQLGLLFIGELMLSSIRVSRVILTPGLDIEPGIVAVPLDARSSLEITLFANLVTLTPGTLSLDVSTDRRTLYVHTMFDSTAPEAAAAIKRPFEEQVLKVTR